MYSVITHEYRVVVRHEFRSTDATEHDNRLWLVLDINHQLHIGE